jgi:hypothetical protein
MKIHISDISSVYSGRPGCCCGCRGKHTYASAHRKWAGDDRGYKISDDEVSDVTVKRIVDKIERLVKEGAEMLIAGNNVSVDTDTRTYIAYLKP